MMHLAALLAVICYLLAAACCVRDVIRQKTGASRVLLPLVVSGFLFHTLALGIIVYQRHVVMTHWSADSLFWFSWILAGLSLLARKVYEYPLTGSFILPLISLGMAGSSVLVHFTGSLPEIESPQLFLLVHLLPIVIAEGCLVLVFCLSLVFLIQEHRLKRKINTMLLLWGPGLDTLSRYHRMFLLCGFVSMTIAVGSGSVRALWTGHPALSVDTYQISALVAWVLMAGLLYVRTSTSMSPRRVCQLTLSLGGMFIVSLVMIRYVFLVSGHGGLYV